MSLETNLIIKPLTTLWDIKFCTSILKNFLFFYRQSYGRCVLRALQQPIERINKDVCTIFSTLLVVSEDEGKFKTYALYKYIFSLNYFNSRNQRKKKCFYVYWTASQYICHSKNNILTSFRSTTSNVSLHVTYPLKLADFQ